MVSNCSAKVKCETCGAENHVTVMHINKHNQKKKLNKQTSKLEESQKHKTIESKSDILVNVVDSKQPSLCTSVCGSINGRSCGKTMLVNVSNPTNGKCLRTYAIVDEQSTNSFATSKLLDALEIDSTPQEYSITTMSSQQSNMLEESPEILKLQDLMELTVSSFHLCSKTTLFLTQEKKLLPQM